VKREEKVALFVGVLLSISGPAASGLCHEPGASRARFDAKAGVRRPAQRAGPVKDLKGLIGKLRAGGSRVRRAGRVSQPFFSVRGRAIAVRGEQVQVFEYANAAAAEREAKLVDPSGSSVGTSMMSWTGPPHFYKGGRLVVLYVGGNQDVIRALESALGPQFAGG
jgi:hypothetical protein